MDDEIKEALEILEADGNKAMADNFRQLLFEEQLGLALKSLGYSELIFHPIIATKNGQMFVFDRFGVKLGEIINGQICKGK